MARASIAAVLIMVMGGCGSSSRGVRREQPLLGAGARQRGLATYYSNSLAGRRTASGERYDPGAMSAAHRVLPLGTRVRVTRLDREGRATSQAVEVRINDRGPFGGRAIIDLSLAAARALAMVQAGVVPVEVEVVDSR